MQWEVQALLEEGVTYIQLDSLRYVTTLADPIQCQQIIDIGQDPDADLDEIIAADHATIQVAKRPGVTLALHLCRCNNRSAWLAEVGYDAIAEKAFSSLQVIILEAPDSTLCRQILHHDGNNNTIDLLLDHRTWLD